MLCCQVSTFLLSRLHELYNENRYRQYTQFCYHYYMNYIMKVDIGNILYTYYYYNLRFKAPFRGFWTDSTMLLTMHSTLPVVFRISRFRSNNYFSKFLYNENLTSTLSGKISESLLVLLILLRSFFDQIESSLVTLAMKKKFVFNYYFLTLCRCVLDWLYQEFVNETFYSS